MAWDRSVYAILQAHLLLADYFKTGPTEWD